MCEAGSERTERVVVLTGRQSNQYLLPIRRAGCEQASKCSLSLSPQSFNSERLRQRRKPPELESPAACCVAVTSAVTFNFAACDDDEVRFMWIPFMVSIKYGVSFVL